MSIVFFMTLRFVLTFPEHSGSLLQGWPDPWNSIISYQFDRTKENPVKGWKPEWEKNGSIARSRSDKPATVNASSHRDSPLFQCGFIPLSEHSLHHGVFRPVDPCAWCNTDHTSIHCKWTSILVINTSRLSLSLFHPRFYVPACCSATHPAAIPLARSSKRAGF